MSSIHIKKKPITKCAGPLAKQENENDSLTKSEDTNFH